MVPRRATKHLKRLHGADGGEVAQPRWIRTALFLSACR